ncbi:3-phosphoshikimate 1-carboxyvinyltransferase [Pelagibacterales bacterium SAG-MED34]|nr:3-phosphoshikimate 1-carboxyvinyltransferase [Pelagibacterales bacterium SAG-MED34]
MSNYILIEKQISKFNKKIFVSSDKSISIRTVLLASQAVGVSKISNLLESEDVLNTLKTIKKLGINYRKKANTYIIEGFGLNGFDTQNKVTIDAGNSGTLARLILGLLVKSKKKVKLIGDKSLSKRDFSRVINPLRKFGANIKSKKNHLPIEILGSEFLRPITYDENIGSAQVKSCMILAALNTPGVSVFNTRASRNHTELMLKFLKYPLKIKKKGGNELIKIQGLSQFKGFNYKVPGDISSASFFIVLTLLSKKSEIEIKNVNVNSSRVGIINILNKMGANIKLKGKKTYKGEKIANIHVKGKENLKAINCPAKLNSSAIDEFLIIFLVAAKSKGISKFKDLGEMNKKESKRLDLGVKFLRSIGIKVDRFKDNVNIHGNPDLILSKKFEMKNFLKDHRIFFLACITALTLGGKWKITDKDSINTSFPNFIKILKKIGAQIH